MTARPLVLALGALVLVPTVGCGDDGALPPDAAGPCWPITSTPGGSVQIGWGDVDWEPMPDHVQIVRNGSQSDPYVYVHSRMRGMPPGDANDFFNPENPRTMVTLVVVETGAKLGTECPARIGYLTSPEAGSFDMLHSQRVGFGTMDLANIEGEHAMITLEVVGANGLYASDQKMVTLSAPPQL